MEIFGIFLGGAAGEEEPSNMGIGSSNQGTNNEASANGDDPDDELDMTMSRGGRDGAANGGNTAPEDIEAGLKFLNQLNDLYDAQQAWRHNITKIHY